MDHKVPLMAALRTAWATSTDGAQGTRSHDTWLPYTQPQNPVCYRSPAMLAPCCPGPAARRIAMFGSCRVCAHGR